MTVRRTSTDSITLGGDTYNTTTHQGGTKITNVADGTAPSDAVNYSQLSNLAGDVTNLSGDVTNIAGSVTNMGDQINNVYNTGTKYFHANSTGADSSAVGVDSVAIGTGAVSSNKNDVCTGRELDDGGGGEHHGRDDRRHGVHVRRQQRDEHGVGGFGGRRAYDHECRGRTRIRNLDGRGERLAALRDQSGRGHAPDAGLGHQRSNVNTLESPKR